VPTDPEQLPEQLQTRLADLEQEVSFLRAAAQAQSRRRHRDWDALAAVIASLVGLLALGISAYTAYVQREQLRAQVWPKLSLGQSNMLHKLYAGNQGVGPARVTAVRVMVDGNPMREWKDVSAAYEYDSNASIIYASLNNRVLPPDKDLEIAAPQTGNETSRALMREITNGEKHRLHITVCYCSVLDDCWVARFGSRPESERDLPDDECPVTEEQRFHD
jgi:hypothetical protein